MKQAPVEVTVDSAPSSTMPPPSIRRKPLPNANPEEIPPSSIKQLVRKLTKKMKPCKEKETPPPREQDPAKDKLAGFVERNPKLYVPENNNSKPFGREIPEPTARVRTLSRGQRLLERLEAPLIIDPTPEREIREQEMAKETMRQSRAARFRNRLEDYF